MAIIPLLTGRRARRFEQQLRPHLPALYRYAYRLCGNRDDAEDLVQELLTRLFEKQAPLDNLEHPQSWLLTVLYRQYIDTRRKSQRTPTDLNDEHSEAILDDLHQSRDTPEYALEQHRLQHEKRGIRNTSAISTAQTTCREEDGNRYYLRQDTKRRSGNILDAVGQIMAGGRRRQAFTILMIEFNGFFHDPAQLIEYLPFVIAMTTTQE